MANDGKDPSEKMKDLHQWILSNKVQAKSEKPPVATTWATKITPKAAGELHDFQNWVREIQTPAIITFEPTF